MHSFKVGDNVSFLNEEGKGVVKRILTSEKLLIEDEFGFEREYLRRNVVPIQSENYQLHKISLDLITNVKGLSPKKKSHQKAKPEKQFKKEIDLHIENLIDSHLGMSNGEILQIQMTEFRRFFKQAVYHKMTKIVVIHGVGEGVLKNEIRTFLDRYEWSEYVEYLDASYQEYGRGATEIKISPSLFNHL